MAVNATELYIEMVDAITRCPTYRTVTDPTSPRKSEVVEAPPGRSFVLRSMEHNLVACVPVDRRKAEMFALHLLSGTELATPLAELPNAGKFLERVGEEYYWRGAYGAIAMPQVERCVRLLQEYPSTRRAVVYMTDGESHDANRPSCWTDVMFVKYRGELHQMVTQRSLNINIMPYDCVCLTELQRYVSLRVGLPPGELHWYVCNLHAPYIDGWKELTFECVRNAGVHVDVRRDAWEMLCEVSKRNTPNG